MGTGPEDVTQFAEPRCGKILNTEDTAKRRIGRGNENRWSDSSLCPLFLRVKSSSLSATMTERLYYHDACLREFDARVLACVPAGEHFEVQLDRTAFYATSGGQPNDTGRLGDAIVLGVREEHNGA